MLLLSGYWAYGYWSGYWTAGYWQRPPITGVRAERLTRECAGYTDAW